MGAGEIDSLEIKIEATAKNANQQLDTLVTKLDKLTTSLGRVNGNSIISLSNGVQRLSNSMQSMKNIGTADFTRLAKNIQKMGQLDSKQLGKAAGSIHRFANSLGSLDKISVSDNAAQIGQLAKGISQLGYKSSTQAIENIPKLATAMRQLMTELSKAPKVSQNLIEMTNALAKLARTGASSGRAATSLGKSLDTYTASTNRASKGTFSLASAIGKLYATYWLFFRAFGKIRDAIDISSDLTEVQNVVDVTFGNMAYKVEDFAKTSIEQFGMSELSLKQYASRFQAMGSAMGISGSSIGSANSFLNKQTNGYIALSDSMSDVSLNLTKLTADMASFYNVEQKDVAEDLESIFTGMTRPLRQYGLDLTEATLKEWALKNGLDADIKSMSQAEKTMLRYQYVLANTGAAQGDFARTADTWANQTRILKQNFQQLASVIGGTFINSLKPIVSAMNSAMSSIIAFAETVSNALGKIFGWKYENSGGGITNDFEDAADSASDIAGSTGQAAKNIEKMRAGIRAFDELKTITKPDSSSGSGSGGSGSSASGGASGGQWVKQESILDSFKSDIDSLYGLGEYIGNTIKGELGGIVWDDVYQSASNFGSGLASFLNGLFEGEKGETLFGSVGTTVAGAFRSAVIASLSFGTELEWEQLGRNISDFFNNFAKEMNRVNPVTGKNGWQELADTIDTFVHGITSMLAEALRTMEWSEILAGFRDFLLSLDADTVATILGAVTFTKVAKRLATGVKTGIKNAGGIKIGGIALTILGFDTAIEGTGTVKDTVKSTLGTSLGTLAVTGSVKVSLIMAGITILVNGATWAGNRLGDAVTAKLAKANGIDPESLELENDISIKQALSVIFEWRKMSDEDKKRSLDKLRSGLNNAEMPFLYPIYEYLFGMRDGMPDAPILVSTLVKTIVGLDLPEANWESFKKKFGVRQLAATLKIVTDAKELFDNFSKKRWGESRTLKVLLEISTIASALWAKFKKSWGTKNLSASLGISTKAKTLFDNFKAKWGNKNLSIGLSLTSGALSGLWKSITTFFSGKSIGIGTSTSASKKADGGAFYNGSWHPVAQYAAGGFPNHGSLFVAGEAGSELVGHIGGRTEVLNQSQLASTMYSSVLSAMETALSKQRGSSQPPIQVYLDGKVVFDNTRERATEYFNRTGEPAFPI